MSGVRVLGLVGWSGSGKTTLLVRLIPLLRARGLSIATLKHAHHAFQPDIPGKDSFEHRRAGAGEVIVSSSGRWMQIHEGGGAPEARLADLLTRFSPCDLILVEGFKAEPYPKLEVFREAVGKPPLHAHDGRIVAVVSDVAFPSASIPVADLDDVAAIADLVLRCAESLETVLAALQTVKTDGPAL